MNLENYTKQITSLFKQSSEYAANIAVKGKQTQESITQRIIEIDLLLNPDSDLLLDVAISEKPIADLVALINERTALQQIQHDYDLSGIAYTGTKPIMEKIDALQNEYRDYFKRQINNKNAEKLIPEFPRKLKTELRDLLEQHQAKIAKENELKTLVDPFMTNLNEMLQQPHIKKFDLSTMQTRARRISPECMEAANQLHQLPLLA